MHEADDERFLAAVGQRIVQLRRQAQLSQEELAEKCGLSRNYIGNLERAEKIASIITIRTIADSLGVTVANFFEPIGK